MMNNLSRLFVLGAAVAALALAGCANLPGSRQTQGTVAGAGAGALAGYAVSDGAIAPVLGAAGGALLGNKLSEDDKDR